MFIRISSLALSLAAAQASASVPATPTPIGAKWLTLGTGRHSSYLRVPEACQYLPCPLVVISHPRQQTAERLRDSSNMLILTQALLKARYVVLLSGDGGPNTWGSPQALQEVASAHQEAVKRFVWNGRTYALGISMGGLLALRSALPDSPYAVSGVALIDAWTDLRLAWGTSVSRRTEINLAYQRTTAPTPDVDPLKLVFSGPPLPLFVAASLEDEVVPSLPNSEIIYAHALPSVSEFVSLNGPHLGGNRFSPEFAQRLVGFYQRLEQRSAMLRSR